MNKEQGTRNKKWIGATLSVFMLIVFVLPSSLALAHDPNDTGSSGFWTPGQPIVPCGGTDSDGSSQPACSKCDLLHLLRHLIDLVLVFLTPVLGTLFFIVAGVMMMLGGDNPGMLSQGKSIFKNTFIGIVIVLMAWLITNTLVQTLAKQGAVGTGGSWFTFSCSSNATSGQCITDPFGTGSTGRFCNNTGQACTSDNDCR